MRVLVPLPDRDFDVTEVAVPWSILRDARHQGVFATERAGTVPAADPRLLTGVLFGQLGAAPEARKRRKSSACRVVAAAPSLAAASTSRSIRSPCPRWRRSGGSSPIPASSRCFTPPTMTSAISSASTASRRRQSSTPPSPKSRANFLNHFAEGEGDDAGDGSWFATLTAFWTQYFIRSSRLRS